MAPQGLSLSASLTAAFSVSIVSGSQRTFCPLPDLDRVLARLMSRGDELRQLAAQLSVLAALEDSIAVGLSRVMGPASPDRGAASQTSGSPLVPAAPAVPAVSAPAPSPSREVAASLLPSASLRASSHRTRTRSRSPVPLPKRAPRAPRRSSSVASGLRGSVALAESGLVTGLATKSCPPVPPSLGAPLTCRSCPPRCLDRVSAPRCRFWTLRSHRSCPPRPLVPRSLRPPPTANGTRSLTHTVPLAPRPPSPSRLSPLELVGVLETSVADVSARLPSAPCGGTTHHNTPTSTACVGCDIVQADHAPDGGVAQGIFHGVLVRHHGRNQEEVEEGLEEEVERREEENAQTTTCTCMDGMR